MARRTKTIQKKKSIFPQHNYFCRLVVIMLLLLALVIIIINKKIFSSSRLNIPHHCCDFIFSSSFNNSFYLLLSFYYKYYYYHHYTSNYRIENQVRHSQRQHTDLQKASPAKIDADLARLTLCNLFGVEKY